MQTHELHVNTISFFTATRSTYLFLSLDMEKEAFVLGVFKDNVPLCRLGDVNNGKRFGLDVGIDIAIVTIYVEGQETKHIHSHGRQVVDCTNDAFSLATGPSGVPFVEILDVRPPVFAPVAKVGGVVKLLVGQELYEAKTEGSETREVYKTNKQTDKTCIHPPPHPLCSTGEAYRADKAWVHHHHVGSTYILWRIRTSFEKVVLTVLKLQVISTNILQAAVKA